MSKPYGIVFHITGPDADQAQGEIMTAVKEGRNIPFDFILNNYNLDELQISSYKGDRMIDNIDALES